MCLYINHLFYFIVDYLLCIFVYIGIYIYIYIYLFIYLCMFEGPRAIFNFLNGARVSLA
jgi:hypothetical protein